MLDPRDKAGDVLQFHALGTAADRFSALQGIEKMNGRMVIEAGPASKTPHPFRQTKN
jgi:hypothetical protein